MLVELTGWRKVEGYLYPSEKSARWASLGPETPPNSRTFVSPGHSGDSGLLGGGDSGRTGDSGVLPVYLR